MPQLQSITVNDRASGGPVAHTFTPRDIRGGVGTVIESASGLPIGANELSISLVKTASRYNGTLRLTLPVVVNETINGVTVPKVARVAFITLKASFDERSTTQERTDAIGMLADALGTGKTLVNDTLVNLEGVY